MIIFFLKYEITPHVLGALLANMFMYDAYLYRLMHARTSAYINSARFFETENF